MAVSGTMAIDRTALWAGSGQIAAQRGTEVWGANWLYAEAGAQNDILVIAEEFRNLSTSGAYATDAELTLISGLLSSGTFSASGAAVLTASGIAAWQVLQASGIPGLVAASGLAIYLDGLLSGRLVGTDIPAAVLAASGAAVLTASGVARAGIENNAAFTTISFLNAPTVVNSGAINLGTPNFPFSGVVLKNYITGAPFEIRIYADGAISGVAIA